MGCAHAKVTLFPRGGVAEVLQMLSDASSPTWLLLYENFYWLVVAKASLTVRKGSRNYLGAEPILLSPITHLCWKGAWVWFMGCLPGWARQPVLCLKKSIEVLSWCLSLLLSRKYYFTTLLMLREYWIFKRLVSKPKPQNCSECDKCEILENFSKL